MSHLDEEKGSAALTHEDPSNEGLSKENASQEASFAILSLRYFTLVPGRLAIEHSCDWAEAITLRITGKPRPARLLLCHQIAVFIIVHVYICCGFSRNRRKAGARENWLAAVISLTAVCCVALQMALTWCWAAGVEEWIYSGLLHGGDL